MLPQLRTSRIRNHGICEHFAQRTLQLKQAMGVFYAFPELC
jgi:hypothetical protein